MTTQIETRPAEASFRKATTHTAFTTGVNRIRSFLLASVKRLEETRAVMASEGRQEEADSIATAIADLCWQHVELMALPALSPAPDGSSGKTPIDRPSPTSQAGAGMGREVGL